MTHPRGFSVTEPSVAAVVGSLDSNTARYAARIRLQGHRIEIIQARAFVLRCHFTQLAAHMSQIDLCTSVPAVAVRVSA